MRPEIKELIETLDIELITGNGSDDVKLKVYAHKLDRMSAAKKEAAIAMLKNNKQEIISAINEIAAEKEEDAKHKHWIYVVGWEAHKVMIDDRKDIKSQCNDIAGDYDDITAEDVERAYAKVIPSKQDEKSDSVDESDKNDFEIVSADDVVQPSGVEYGVDGCATLTLKSNKTGDIVQMVERNVFDFGHYSFPLRFVNTDDALKTDNWTDTEKDAGNWIEKYGVLPKNTFM